MKQNTQFLLMILVAVMLFTNMQHTMRRVKKGASKEIIEMEGCPEKGCTWVNQMNDFKKKTSFNLWDMRILLIILLFLLLSNAKHLNFAETGKKGWASLLTPENIMGALGAIAIISGANRVRQRVQRMSRPMPDVQGIPRKRSIRQTYTPNAFQSNQGTTQTRTTQNSRQIYRPNQTNNIDITKPLDDEANIWRKFENPENPSQKAPILKQMFG